MIDCLESVDVNLEQYMSLSCSSIDLGSSFTACGAALAFAFLFAIE